VTEFDQGGGGWLNTMLFQTTDDSVWNLYTDARLRVMEEV